MKLWQKLYLYLMVLMTMDLLIFSGVFAQMNYRQSMAREQEGAAREHSTLANALRSALMYEMIVQGLDNQEDLLDAVAQQTQKLTLSRDGLGVELFQGNNRVFSNRTETENLEERAELRVPSGQCYVTYSNQRMYASSVFVLNGTDYILVTSTDASFLLNQRRQQLWRLAQGGLIFTGLLGLSMMVILKLMLGRVSLLANASRRLSQGDYSVRLNFSGRDELAVLGDSFNEMAQSVESNIQELQSVAEDRKKFIDNLAHEMKTPLTSIIGYADLLRSARKLDDTQRLEYADAIYQEGKHLKTFSAKLMELILVGKSSLDKQKVELNEFLQELAQLLEPILSQRGLTMVVACTGRITLFMDKAMVQSMLSNLVDNAAKASPAGSKIELTARRDRRERVHISVIDHGRGMPSEETRKVTQAFYMLDKARTRAEGGAGLGLALCLEIARGHNAQMNITSHEGVGTAVEIVFPSEVSL